MRPTRRLLRLLYVFCVCVCCTCIVAPPGGLTKLGSDPMKAVNDVVEESGNVISVLYRFAANLIAPGEDDGTFHKAEESNHVNVNASLHFMLTMLTISRLK